MNQQAPFETFASFVASVISAAGDGPNDSRLQAVAAALGQYEGSGQAGGYLVPPGLTTELWLRAYAAGRILARCDRQPVTSRNDITVPVIQETSRVEGSRFGAAQMFWTDEAAPATGTKPKLGELKLHLNKLLALIYASDELVEDVVAFAEALKRIFAIEAAFKIEDSIINGSGAGVPLGVLNSGALIKVAKDGSQASGTISRQNLINMASRLWGPSHATAVWLMSNDAYAVIEALGISNEVEIFTTGPDPDRRYLLQMPVELCEYTPPLSALGDVMLCDFSQYLLIQSDPTFLSSIHVNFLTDESAFRVRYRVDGQPGWATPVTPKNSTNTQSPFIALDAR